MFKNYLISFLLAIMSLPIKKNCMFGLFLIHQISLHAEEMCTANKVCCLSFIYLFFKYLFAYLFGCAGSQLQHVGSSSLPRYHQTWAPCIDNTDSEPLDYQGNPYFSFNLLILLSYRKTFNIVIFF